METETKQFYKEHTHPQQCLTEMVTINLIDYVDHYVVQWTVRCSKTFKY